MENKIMKIESTKEFNEEGLNSLTGQENNIKTFCIIIGESSIVRTIKPKRKPKTITQPMSLTDSLKFGIFAWLNIRGKYDIDKTPKIIFNIPLSTAKCFGLKYSHQPFIFGRIIDGKLNFELYLINAEKTDYKLEDVDVLIDININTLITDTMIDIYKDSPITEQSPNMVAALFTYISNKYKLNIPFEYFNEACDSFNNRINEIKNKHPRYKEVYDICLDASLCESRNGKSQYLNRSLIYGGLFR